MANVLAILAEGFEEIEAIAPVDLLRRAGVEVTTAALVSMHVTGRCGVTLHADTTLEAVGDRVFDALFLPGGPGVAKLRADSRVAATVRHHLDAGKWVAAICAAPTVLNDLGLLAGRRYTAHGSVAGELPHILSAERVVEDGQIITSRGAGTAVDLGLFLVEKLTSRERSAEIGRSIEA